MAIDQSKTVIEYLRNNGKNAPTLAQDMVARVEHPVLEQENLWQTWLDSRVFYLTGGVNEEGLMQFKEDHNPDLDSILKGAKIDSDGSIHCPSNEIYTVSDGTPFVHIPQRKVKGAKAEYAMPFEQYKSVIQAIRDGKLSIEQLEEFGGFKINTWLKPEEVVSFNKDGIRAHNGWKQHAVGMNNATESEYDTAKILVVRYSHEAAKQGCFNQDGTGMGYFVDLDAKTFKVRPWCLLSSGNGSDAGNRNRFDNDGRFLRVRDLKVVAEGDSRKVDPSYRQFYDEGVKGEGVVHSPHGKYVLADPKAKI